MGGTGLLSRLHNFLVAPLSSSPRDLFLIVGLLLIIVYMWTRILGAFTELVKAGEKVL